MSLTACGLPSAAPTVSQVERDHTDVLLLKMTPAVAGVLANVREAGFPSVMRRDGFKPNTAVHAGDMVAVTVYETGGPSLFGGTAVGVTTTPDLAVPSAPKTTTVPPQVIESSGEIAIPFVGRMNIAGLTPLQAAKRIEAKLGEKTIRPQVIVSLVGYSSTVANVGGDVNKPGLVPLTLRGERLLDVIAAAGGSKDSEFDTDIRIIRGKSSATVSLLAVVTNSNDNIIVHPDDQIFLEHNPKTYSVMGAAQKVSQYPLDQPKVSLAEAVARAGGSGDNVGDISGVYLFRVEPAEVIRAIFHADAGAMDPASPTVLSADTVMGPTPVMYRVDFNKADGYFQAKSIALRDKDVVLITEAEGTQLLKLFTVARGATGIFSDVSKNYVVLTQ